MFGLSVHFDADNIREIRDFSEKCSWRKYSSIISDGREFLRVEMKTMSCVTIVESERIDLLGDESERIYYKCTYLRAKIASGVASNIMRKAAILVKSICTTISTALESDVSFVPEKTV